MTVERKIWIGTIGFIGIIEWILYLSSSSWKAPLIVYIIPLTLLLPVWIANNRIKILSDKEKNVSKQLADLKGQLQILEQEKKDIQFKEKEFEKLLAGIPSFVFSFDVKTRKWILSNSFQEFPELETLDLYSGIKCIEDQIHEMDKAGFLKVKDAFLTGTPTVFEFRTVGNNGQLIWNELRINPVINTSGELERVIGIIMDVSDRKEKEEDLAQMAFYDTLTELPNRTMLRNHLKKVLSRAKRKDHEVTVLFIDLDGFKGVNDSLGHDAGDILLKEVASRLVSTLREEDLISRLGGDEFIIVLEETAKEEVTLIAERILNNLSTPYFISEQSVSVTPSIGISMYPEDGNTMEDLMKSADKAMYLAKSKGKSNYQYYSPDLEDFEPKETLMEKVLKWVKK